jgi:hypothetical protein
MAQKYDILHIEDAVTSSFEAFCEHFEITSSKDKKAVLQAFADVAKTMKGRQ